MKKLLSFFLLLFLLNDTISQSQNLGTSPEVKQLAAGTNHSMALLVDGTIWTWGKNSSGQLGDSSTKDRYMPVKIGTDSAWRFIAAGNNISYGIKSDGSLWGWGTNKVGQLGISTRNFKYDYWAPVQIGTTTDWQTVCPSISFTIGLKKDGTIWAWGNRLDNLQEQESNPYQPVKLTGNDNSNWAAIAAGDDFFVAQKNDGTLYTRGLFNNTQYNDGGKTAFYKVNDDTDWTSFSAGKQHVVAIKKDGSLWGWGNNEVGQLGNGSNSNAKNPVKIIRVNDWQKVTAAGDYTFALKKEGTAWFWGKAFFKNSRDKYFTNPASLPSERTYICLAASSKTFLLSLQEEKLRGLVEDYKEAYGQESTIKMFIKY